MKFTMRAAVVAAQVLFVMVVPCIANAAILATVGSSEIKDDDIKGQFESMTGEQRKAINEDEMTRKNLVDSAVNAEVLFQAAKKAGLDKDDEYKKAMDRFQRQYLASQFMRKNIEAKLKSSDLKKFYEENKAFFDSTQVCAQHIVVKEEKEAAELTTKAKAKGVKFEELAKKHSLDPSVQENKGNLGCFTRDKMVPEFAAAAFNMKKGEIKGPVQSMYGYHVIKVLDVKIGKVPGFDEVEQRVKETLKMKLVSELLQDLRTKSNVKLNEEAVKKFKL
jgi:peptidyl-prolyl cis-trans isomerase C